jgi:hypothetical protein
LAACARRSAAGFGWFWAILLSQSDSGFKVREGEVPFSIIQ